VSTGGRRVLLVDDAAEVRLLLQVLLELDGFTVTTAEDGPAGLAAVVADRPDVVLLDVQLPGMDGTQVLSALRADPETASLPVVFLTGAPPE
jgi:CheY-like chemotaxis protein